MQPDNLLLDNGLFFAEATRLLSEGRSVTIRAKGRSMFPFIHDGDCVVLKKPDKVGVGDIVLADIPAKGYVLHRVYKACGNGLMLMGDGNLHDTERCHVDSVAGAVVEIRHNGRSVDCSSASERRKAALWRRLLPVRRYILFVCRLYFRTVAG